MQDKYINHIDTFKATQIFTHMQDIDTLFTRYQKKQISKETAQELIYKKFEYLKGFLFGLGVKHNYKIFFHQGEKFEYICLYNNASRTIKYSLCINLSKFYVLYKRKDLKNGSI